MKVVNHLVYLEWMWEPFHYVIVVCNGNNDGNEKEKEDETITS